MNSEDLAGNPEFKSILVQIAGEHGFEVAKSLMSNGEATGEEIASYTDIPLKLVRKILYDFYDNRVVSYRRTHEDSSGWYTYHWRLEADRALELLNEKKRTLVQKIQERLTYERETMFFSCDNDCPRVNFDDAFENNFRCPLCGEELQSFDNSGIIDSLERRVESLKRELVGS